MCMDRIHSFTYNAQATEATTIPRKPPLSPNALGDGAGAVNSDETSAASGPFDPVRRLFKFHRSRPC